MRKLLRKVLLIIVLFTPLFINTDCKKQKRCGCRGDVLFEYGYESLIFFDEESTVITMQREGQVGYYYDYYTFCNPDEVMPELSKFKPGVVLGVTGNVYWDCNYVMRVSSNPYATYGRAYNIYVTGIYMNMYGSDETDEKLKEAK